MCTEPCCHGNCATRHVNGAWTAAQRAQHRDTTVASWHPQVRSNRISIRGETQVTTSSRAPTWISVRNATRFAYVAITVYFGWRLYGVLTAPLSRPQMGAGTSAEQGVVAHGVDGGIEVALTARGIAAEQAGGEIFSGAALQEGAHHHAQESGVGGTQSDAAGTEL